MSWFGQKIADKITHRQEIDAELLRLEGLYKQIANQLSALQEMMLDGSRLAVLERDRDELYARIDRLQDRIATLEIEDRNDERVRTLEQDRSELYSRSDRLQEQVTALEHRNDERVSTLEQDRSELYSRSDRLQEQVTALEHRNDERVSTLEQDRDELFQSNDLLHDILNRMSGIEASKRLQILEKNREEIFCRIDRIEQKLRACGLTNLNARLDSRIIRLEILWYYRNSHRRDALNAEQIKLLDWLENDFDYERSKGRTYPEDWLYETISDKPVNYEIKEDDGDWYADLDGKKLYLGENKQDAEAYLAETIYWLEGDTPHRYIDVQADGIDIPDGSILVDVGAAEGYLGIRYLERCKKIYFFEYDERWLHYLRRTCACLGDKVEIVEGRVGDRPGEIRLDDFFKEREKPSHIKMDVEGSEGSVLRGMTELLENHDPLTLFICTYHRQEDQKRYYDMLKENFEISFSKGYYWDMQDPYPPFFRRGIMRAVKKP